MLSEIEAIKTHTFTLNLNNLTTTTPLYFSYTLSSVNIGFAPDFVKAKMGCIFDPTNSSTGLYDVHANFIRDNGVLISVPSLPITNSNHIAPDLTHQYVSTNQLQFTVSSSYLENAPSASAYIVITLEFLKLKKKH